MGRKIVENAQIVDLPRDKCELTRGVNLPVAARSRVMCVCEVANVADEHAVIEQYYHTSYFVLVHLVAYPSLV